MEKIDTNNALFTNYVFKSIPLAFDESMSYYEFLSAILSYLKDTMLPKMNEIIEEQNTFETKIADYDEKFEDFTTRLNEVEEVVKTFKPYTDEKVEALRTEIITLIDDVKSTYLKKTDLTPQLLQTKIEGSNDVVVDVNETDDKLQVRLDDKVRSNVAKNPTITLNQAADEDVKVKESYTNLKDEEKSSEIALTSNDFKVDTDGKLHLVLHAGDNITINENNVISAIQGGGVATNYDNLTNKPKINGTILSGDIALSTLNIYSQDEVNAIDEGIQANIDAEVKSRKDADTQLQSNITAEQNARVDAISGLSTDLSTETNAREVADSELQTNINNKVSDVQINGASILDSNKVANITIDQTYNASSTNAQSGVAVASAIASAITNVINADY